eukprot:4074138-Pyramimonas_sp.AAC.1
MATYFDDSRVCNVVLVGPELQVMLETDVATNLSRHYHGMQPFCTFEFARTVEPMGSWRVR